MTEAQFSQKLRKELQKRLPGAVIFKHNDSITGGVPDFSVTLNRRTTWVEVKLAGNKPEDSKLQFETMKRLSLALYIIWDPQTKRGDLFWVDEWFDEYDPTYIFNFDSIVIELASYIQFE